MTSDQMVLRQAATAAAAVSGEPAAAATAEAVSSTSFIQWCTLDVTGRALICAACDVSWLSETGETCWVCGEHGRAVGDLRHS